MRTDQWVSQAVSIPMLDVEALNYKWHHYTATKYGALMMAYGDQYMPVHM